jgi:hypothetical protein
MFEFLNRARVAISLQTILRESESVVRLQPLIPFMVALIFALAADGCEDEALNVMDFFRNAAQIKFPLLDDSFEPVANLMITLITDKNMSFDVCRETSKVLVSLIQNKSHMFHSQQILTHLLSCFKICAVELKYVTGERLNALIREAGSGEPVDDEAVRDQHLVIVYVLNELSRAVPAKHLTQLMLQTFTGCCQSTDADERRFGCDVIAATVEGLRESYRLYFHSLVPAVLEKVADPVAFVREGALHALSRLSQHGWPEIFHYHATVLPVLCTALADDANIYVQAEGCDASETFTEYLSKDTMRPYLQQFLLLLGNILTCSKPIVVSMSLVAIGTVAASAQEDFLPYVDAILSFLQPLLFDAESTHSEVRVQAMVVLGQIATAVGKETFAPHFATGLKSIFENVVSASPRLLECRYIYYRNTAKTMGEDLEPHFAQILPDLLKMIVEAEPHAGPSEGAFGESQSIDEDEDECDEDNNDMEEYDENADLDADEGQFPPGVPFDFGAPYEDLEKTQELHLSNRKSAILALGSIVEHAPLSFYPRLDEFVAAMTSANIFQHDSVDVAGTAHLILGKLTKCACVANGINTKPVPGQILTLPQAVVDRVSQYMRLCIETMANSTDEAVVVRSCEPVIEIVDIAGYAVLMLPVKGKPIGEILFSQILLFLLEKAKCQQESEEGTSSDDDNHGDHNEGEEEDGSNKKDNSKGSVSGSNGAHESQLVESMFCLISSVAKAAGPKFQAHFDSLLPHILKFTDVCRPYVDRTASIGCLSECFVEMGPSCVKHAPVMLKLLSEGLRDASAVNSVRRNCAYALGTFISATGTQLVDHFKEFLQWLRPLCIRPENQGFEDGGADVDNALTAVCHMIRASPEHVPLSEMLPIILAAMPIREDFGEAVNIYKCLYELLQASNPTAISCLTPILACFGNELLVTSKRVSFDSTPTANDDIVPKDLVVEQLKLLASSSISMRDMFLESAQSVQDEQAKHALEMVLKSS